MNNIEKFSHFKPIIGDAMVIGLNGRDINYHAVAALFLGISPESSSQYLNNSIQDGFVDYTKFSELIYEKLIEKVDRIISPKFHDDQWVLINFVPKIFELQLKYAENVYKNIKNDVITVVDKRNFLLSKKRSLMALDRFGDLDDSKWIRFITDFTHIKLKAGCWTAWLEESLNFSPEYFSNQIMKSELSADHSAKAVLEIVEGELITNFLQLKLSDKVNYFDVNYKKSGREYEVEVTNRLTKVFPEFSVELTPSSGDQGADIIICSPNLKIVIQSKYYSSSVGNSAVQEIFSAKAFYSADYAVVVCNSEYTRSAKNLADKTGVILLNDEELEDAIKKIIF